jgi:hypothetical protein
MAAPSGESFCTACGWSGHDTLAGCPACGSSDLADVSGGALVTLPPGKAACAACGTQDRPLAFRGTSRIGSVIWLLRSRRVSGYWCEGCARKQTALSLAYTGLFGWWGFLGAFFWTPRATYHNWRAVWSPPRKPLDWGAWPLSEAAAEFAEAGRRDDQWSPFDPRETAAEGTP